MELRTTAGNKFAVRASDPSKAAMGGAATVVLISPEETKGGPACSPLFKTSRLIYSEEEDDFVVAGGVACFPIAKE